MDRVTDGIGSRGVMATASPIASGPILDRQRGFLEAIGRHRAGPVGSARGPRGDDDPARQAAEQFVAATFVQPILKEARAQNRAPAPFGPSEAEKTLGPLMDAMLADRIVRARGFGIVDRIASDLGRVGQRLDAGTAVAADG